MKSWVHSKIFMAGLVLTLVVTLIVALALPVMANDSNPAVSSTDNPGFNIIKGKVVSIASDKLSFQVTQHDGSAVAIQVDTNTRYFKIESTPSAVKEMKAKVQERWQEKKGETQEKGQNRFNERGLGNKSGQTLQNTPDPTESIDEDDIEETPEAEECLAANTEAPKGWFNKIKSWFNRSPKFGQNAGFEDIQVGDGVLVRVMPNENLAKQVLIVKASNIKTVKGQIGSIGANSFVINTNTTPSETLTLVWNENTSVILKGAIGLEQGQSVRVVYKVEGDTILALTVTMVSASLNTTDDID